MRLEFYFDFTCPYAYLASTRIEALARRHGAELEWKPMLLGGVFRAVGTPDRMADGMPAAKQRHNTLDMHRWAELWQVPLTVPPGHPIRSVRALRTLLATPPASWPPIIHALYRAYWQAGDDLGDAAVLRAALAAGGVTGAAADRALAAADDPAIKDELRRRTDEAIGRGIFGAPTVFVSRRPADPAPLMFWGQDRLGLVEAVLGGWDPASGQPAPRPALPATGTGAPAVIELFYDFSSPFAHVGVGQIEAVAARAGARLEWRPILLGALFRQIGTPDVPLHAMSEARRRYQLGDLALAAAAAGLPLRFASHFPLRTVTALRLALLAGDRIAALSHALFRAAWQDDRDLGDDAVLAAILAEVGLPAELLAETRTPEVKARLVAATAEASARGVFGAPTAIVRWPEREEVFWGQDRLELVERAAAGWRPRAGGVRP